MLFQDETAALSSEVSRFGMPFMDSQTIRSDSLYLLMLAGLERNEARAEELRYRAAALGAQADHLDRTGHYIELPIDVGALIQHDPAPRGA